MLNIENQTVNFRHFVPLSTKINVVYYKSAVIVTHRLGSVKLADRVLVMKEGKAIQLGTHAELMAQEAGEYRRLYHAQEKWYQTADAASSS